MIQKHKGRERKCDWITLSLFPSTPWKNLSFVWTFDPEERGKYWNHSSSKGTWGPWEDLQEEPKRMETDFGFLTRVYYCFVEWLTTYSHLDMYALMLGLVPINSIVWCYVWHNYLPCLFESFSYIWFIS